MTLQRFHLQRCLLPLVFCVIDAGNAARSAATFAPPIRNDVAVPSKIPSVPVLLSPRLPRAHTFSFAAKRKGSGGAPTSSKKLQVKLLKYVPGIGQKGDVVRVSPAVLNNVLKPSQSAELITDDEIEKERAAAAALERETDQIACSLKKEIEAKTFVLIRKAGPDGRLFGGVGPKAIVDELKSGLGKSGDFLESKGVKVSAIVDSNGATIQGDIKQIGPFIATLSLTKDVAVKMSFEVKPE